MKIGTLAFAGSDITLGLAIVKDAIQERFHDVVFFRADETNAKEADYLLVSIYWWRDYYEYIRFLVNAGIDPRNRKPVIILGGMMMVNPRPLKPYGHYFFVGDGEAGIADLIDALENKRDSSEVRGVWNESGVAPGYAPQLKAKAYIDLRTNKTTRIEIARGCKMQCAFCQLRHTKPYRELPFDAVRYLIQTAETKTIALFAPDSWSHSRAMDIEDCCRRLGKNNSGSDVRLEMLKSVKHIKNIRFGIEGFGIKARKRIGKLGDQDKLKDLLIYLMRDFEANGKRATSATCYMIGNLPGETKDDVESFWQLLSEVDAELKNKFTLFLSVSSFAPSPFTPMERDGIDPWSDFGRWIKDRKISFKNIVIASRGGLISAPQRLCQMLTIRGDEKASRVLHWITTKASYLTHSTDKADGDTILRACKAAGFDGEYLHRKIKSNELLPWHNIKHECQASLCN